MGAIEVIPTLRHDASHVAECEGHASLPPVRRVEARRVVGDDRTVEVFNRRIIWMGAELHAVLLRHRAKVLKEILEPRPMLLRRSRRQDIDRAPPLDLRVEPEPQRRKRRMHRLAAELPRHGKMPVALLLGMHCKSEFHLIPFLTCPQWRAPCMKRS